MSSPPGITRKLWEQAQDAEERAWVGDIQESGDALDRLYRDALLPAVVATDQAAVTATHGRALELVATIQARADALARRFDASIGSFEEHVGAVEHVSFRSHLPLPSHTSPGHTLPSASHGPPWSPCLLVGIGAQA